MRRACELSLAINGRGEESTVKKHTPNEKFKLQAEVTWQSVHRPLCDTRY